MRTDIRDALESGCSVEPPVGLRFGQAKPMRRNSIARVRAILFAVLQELPDDMTVSELRSEIDINSVQEECS